MPVRILIVDDHEVVREGVRTILRRVRPAWEISGEAAEGKEAIDAAARLKPDIILMDITMPGMSGLDASSRISKLGLSARILIFTMHESAQLAREARIAGAKGYVVKSEAARDLVTAIEALLSDRTFFGGPGPVNFGEPGPVKTAEPEPGQNSQSEVYLRTRLAS